VPLIERIHEAGGRVIVWTVNSAADADALRAAGVDGICSDDLRVVRPRELRKA
jgi:glycerophosphoryl diester phosphodiesterase